MKHHTYFSPRLFLDALRRLRLPALIFGVTAVVITLLPPCVNLLDGWSGYSIDIAGVAPALWGYMFIGGVGLVMCAFSFLNKRSSSDFYHSLPETSVCTWCSTALAVFVCIFVTVTATVLAAFSGYALSGSPVSWDYLPYLLGYFLAGTALCAACALFAHSLTGTALSNLTVAALLLFFPRFLLSMLASSVTELAGIVPEGELGLLLNPQYNIPAALNPVALLFGNSFFGGSYGDITFAPAFLYTGVLALAYAGGALLLYRVRKSECAGSSAVSRPVQGLFRCLCTLPTLLAIPMAILASGGNSFDDNVSLIFLLLVVSAVVYFLYEIVTTRRFRNLLRALPLFIVLCVAAPLAFTFAARLSANALLDDIPAPEEVKYVVFERDLYSSDSVGSKYSGRYAGLLASHIRFYEDDITALCAEVLASTAGDAKEGVFAGQYACARVIFRAGGRSITRYVYFSESELRRLEAFKLQNADYRAALTALPPESEIRSVHANLDDVGSDRVWALFRAEYDEEAAAYSGTSFGTISVSGYRGLDAYSVFYALTPATPAASAEYLARLNAESSLSAADIFAALSGTPQEYCSVYIRVISSDPALDGRGYSYSFYPDDGSPQEGLAHIRELLSGALPGDPDPTGTVLEIDYGFENERGRCYAGYAQ